LQPSCCLRFRRLLDLVDSRTPSNILLRNALSICLSILTVIVVGCDSLLLRNLDCRNYRYGSEQLLTLWPSYVVQLPFYLVHAFNSDTRFTKLFGCAPRNQPRVHHLRCLKPLCLPRRILEQHRCTYVLIRTMTSCVVCIH
jgi:hypothetical protein